MVVRLGRHTLYYKGLSNDGRTNLCLDQVVALVADVHEVSDDIDTALVLNLFNHCVNHNACSCATNSRAVTK